MKLARALGWTRFQCLTRYLSLASPAQSEMSNTQLRSAIYRQIIKSNAEVSADRDARDSAEASQLSIGDTSPSIRQSVASMEHAIDNGRSPDKLEFQVLLSRMLKEKDTSCIDKVSACIERLKYMDDDMLLQSMLHVHCLDENNAKAQELFADLDKRRAVNDYTLGNIATLYRKLKMYSKCYDVMNEFERRDIAPSTFTYEQLLHACACDHNLTQAQKFLELMHAQRLKVSIPALSALMMIEARRNNAFKVHEYAEIIMQRTMLNSADSCNVLKAYMLVRDRDKIYETIDMSILRGVRVSRHLARHIMSAYALYEDWEGIDKVLQSTWTEEERENLVAGAAKAFLTSNQPARALAVLKSWDGNVLPDVYEALMKFYATEADYRMATRLYEEMRRVNMVITPTVYVHLLDVYARSFRIKDLEASFKRAKEELRARGARPTQEMYGQVIRALSQFGFVEKAEEFYREMTSLGIGANEVIDFSLVENYENRSELDGMKQYMSDLKERGTARGSKVFGSVAHALIRHDDLEGLKHLVAEQKKEVGTPSRSFFVDLLAAFVSKRNTRAAHVVLSEMVEAGHEVGKDVLRKWATLSAFFPDRTSWTRAFDLVPPNRQDPAFFAHKIRAMCRTAMNDVAAFKLMRQHLTSIVDSGNDRATALIVDNYPAFAGEVMEKLKHPGPRTREAFAISLGRSGRLDEMESEVTRLRRDGFTPTIYVLSKRMSVYVDREGWSSNRAFSLFAEAIEEGYGQLKFLYNVKDDEVRTRLTKLGNQDVKILALRHLAQQLDGRIPAGGIVLHGYQPPEFIVFLNRMKLKPRIDEGSGIIHISKIDFERMQYASKVRTLWHKAIEQHPGAME